MKKINLKELKKDLLGLKRNILLKNYTTFKIGGRAKYFFVAKRKKDLIKAVMVAKKLKLPLFILGGGSNILVSDKGYNGLVIKIKNQKSKIKNAHCSHTENQKSKIIEIEVDAGALLNQLVNIVLKNNLTGLEWAVGIPGTVAGAIHENTGTFGRSMANILKNVEVLNSKNLKTKILKNRDCKFSYRDSIFRHNKNLIVLSAEIQLKKGNKKEIKKKIKEYLDYRKRTQPLNFPSAGSIFKNPAPEQSSVRGKSLHFSAGKLIEECGLKGKRIGNVKISEKHANFIINLGGGEAKDVIKLINLAKKKVKERFKINLEEEISYLGF